MHAAANLFSREITRHFDSYFQQYDLATSYVELLLIIDDREEVTQNDLAEEMQMAPSTITRFVNKLVKKGLLEKKKVGREAHIRLSNEGNTRLPEFRKQMKKAISDLKSILGEKYVHTTKGLMLHGVQRLKEES